MKPTPRTYGRGVAGEPNATVVHAARDLERQLSDALEREKALRQELAVNERNAERLLDTAKAVISRWDTPSWKDVPSTASFVNKLRNAITAYESGDEPTYTDCPIHGRHEGDCPRC